MTLFPELSSYGLRHGKFLLNLDGLFRHGKYFGSTGYRTRFHWVILLIIGFHSMFSEFTCLVLYFNWVSENEVQMNSLNVCAAKNPSLC